MILKRRIHPNKVQEHKQGCHSISRQQPVFPAGTEKSGNGRGRKRLGSCSLGVRASPRPLPDPAQGHSLLWLRREERMQVAEDGDVQCAHDASRRAVQDALGRRRGAGREHSPARGGPAVPGRGVSAGAPWPPAAHAVSSGASSSPRTRSRSCAVPSHGGASWEPLHHPWNVRTDSAATEHGFAAQRNPGAAARRPARGAGPSRTGAPLGAISEPFVCCSTLRHSRRGSIYWKMRIRLFPLKSFCTAKETIKI